MNIKKAFIYHVISLPQKDAGVENPIIRLHPATVRRLGLKRRQLVTVSNMSGDKQSSRIMVYALGAGRVRLKHERIAALDYDAMHALNITNLQGCNLEIATATWMQILSFYWNHPDPGLKISHRLGLSGFAMGLIGLLVGVLPMM